MGRIIQEKEELGEGRVGQGECWDVGLEINREGRVGQDRAGHCKEGRAEISHNVEDILYCLSQNHHSILFWLMAYVL